MPDPGQNRITACKKFFVSKKTRLACRSCLTVFCPPSVPRSILYPSMPSTARPFRSAPTCYSAPFPHVPSHDLRPACIIDGHRTAQIVIAESAQIANLVARLGECMAEASQKNHRKPRIQKFRNRRSMPYLLFSSGKSRRAEMASDLRHTPLSVPPIHVQFGGGAVGVPPAEQLRGPTGQRFRAAQPCDGLTMSWGDRETTDRAFSPTFHTHLARGYEI